MVELTCFYGMFLVSLKKKLSKFNTSLQKSLSRFGDLNFDWVIVLEMCFLKPPLVCHCASFLMNSRYEDAEQEGILLLQ